MKINKLFLGIDTSCYTTSICFLNEAGQVCGEERRILRVRPGRCGLQQSEMLYQHTRNLPELMEAAYEKLQQQFGSLAGAVKAIAVSSQPRPLPDSYMPAFLAGLGLARSLGAVLQVPVWTISHQENHLEAGVWSAGGPQSQRFLLLHASGGTTDLLGAASGGLGERYKLKEIGGSSDLHAGQYIDRVGVALGLAFPCGPALETLAAKAEKPLALPVAVRGCELSFAGPASAALRALKAGADPASLAAGVLESIGKALTKIIIAGAEAEQVQDVLLVGGVGSDTAIRQLMSQTLKAHKIKLWVPEGRYSCDNASGCAAFARRRGSAL